MNKMVYINELYIFSIIIPYLSINKIENTKIQKMNNIFTFEM
jgi:hypothetical protein